MNVVELEKQMLPYLIRLAESPPVQAEIEAAKTAIISIVENQSVSIFQRIIRWIRNKLIKGDKIMSGTVNITVKNSEGTGLSGAAISYLVNASTVTGTTDSAGLFTVSDLPAGTYEFVASLNGYDSGNISLTVADDATAEGVITLTASTVTTSEAASTAKTEVTTAVITAATTESNNIISKLILLADQKIAELEAEENGNSKSDYVKYVRDPFEVIVIKSLIVLATAGSAAAIASLTKKLSK